MTQNGQAFELPTPVHPTTDSESSLLRTPAASEGERGHQPEEVARARGGQVTLSGQFLPTPTTQDNSGKCRDHGGDLLHDLTCGCSRAERRNVLPTPTVFHTTMHDEPIEYFLEREQRSSTGQIGKSLGVAVRMEMLPTPLVDDSKNTGHNKTRIKTLASETYQMTNWGRFEPAIKRWEEVLGRPAPAPTNPDGKDGNHRLSSKFTEWMMGLPDGWITDSGLTRNEELKACGNGVVPQQAELALTQLLKGIEL